MNVSMIKNLSHQMHYSKHEFELLQQTIHERFEEVIDGYSKQLDVILKKEETGQALSSREKSNKRAFGINSNASCFNDTSFN